MAPGSRPSCQSPLRPSRPQRFNPERGRRFTTENTEVAEDLPRLHASRAKITNPFCVICVICGFTRGGEGPHQAETRGPRSGACRGSRHLFALFAFFAVQSGVGGVRKGRKGSSHDSYRSTPCARRSKFLSASSVASLGKGRRTSHPVHRPPVTIQTTGSFSRNLLRSGDCSECRIPPGQRSWMSWVPVELRRECSRYCCCHNLTGLPPPQHTCQPADPNGTAGQNPFATSICRPGGRTHAIRNPLGAMPRGS